MSASVQIPARETALMTAAVLYGREDVKIEQVEIPRIASDEILVRVRVALTCGTDLKTWKQGFHARMIQPPALFGHELAGVVEEVGDSVRNVRRGMRVVPANSAPCNECFYCRKGQPNLCEDLLFNNGAYAEFIRVPGRIVRENTIEIPKDVSFLDAAMAEPLACVLRGIHETGIRRGDTVAVIGCGAIGLKFIRILAARGARVIAVAKRASQVETARRLGAALAVDSSLVDNPVAALRELTGEGRGCDAVIEAAGQPLTWEWAMQMARKGGTVQLFAGCAKGTSVRLDPWSLHYSEITLKSSFHHTPRFMREAMETIARGEIRAADFVTGESKLEQLPAVFRDMLHRNGALKTAIIP